MAQLEDFIARAEEEFVKLFNSYSVIEKRKTYYVEDVAVFPSEIHAINAIAENGSLNISELANVTGLSKGAISKMARKLEKMDLLRRYHYVDNKKDVYFHLTPEGNRLNEGHRDYHTKRSQKLHEQYESISQDHAEAIITFLQRYHQVMVEFSHYTQEGETEQNE